MNDVDRLQSSSDEAIFIQFTSLFVTLSFVVVQVIFTGTFEFHTFSQVSKQRSALFRFNAFFVVFSCCLNTEWKFIYVPDSVMVVLPDLPSFIQSSLTNRKPFLHLHTLLFASVPPSVHSEFFMAQSESWAQLTFSPKFDIQ